jgi:hypothetical protein
MTFVVFLFPSEELPEITSKSAMKLFPPYLYVVGSVLEYDFLETDFEVTNWSVDYGLNLYSEGLSWFSPVPQDKRRDSTSIRQRPFPSKSIPVHHSSSYYPMLCGLAVLHGATNSLEVHRFHVSDILPINNS